MLQWTGWGCRGIRKSLQDSKRKCYSSLFHLLVISLWHLNNLFCSLIWSKLPPTNCMQITGHVWPSLPAVDIDIFNQLSVGSSQTRQAGRESTRLKSKLRDRTPEGHVLPCLPRSMSLAMLSTHVKIYWWLNNDSVLEVLPFTPLKSLSLNWSTPSDSGEESDLTKSDAFPYSLSHY